MDLMNEPMNEALSPVFNPAYAQLTEVLKLGLITSSLSPKDIMFMNTLLDSSPIVIELMVFLKEKGTFTLHHIPELIVFITQKFSLDKQKKLDLLECVKYVAQTVLSSNAVPLTATERAVLFQVLNASFTLLETNLRKPNSRGFCFFFNPCL